ncbi:MAG: putative acyl-CoA synthetase [Aeromicrobium sp.]|nr:putative acyl-CoA synthetase [Aeromicrobium sp.]
MTDAETLGEALAAAEQQHGDREAYVDGDVRLSFASWVARARSLAGRLIDLGVRPGDVVAIMVGPGVDYAVSCAGIAWAGAVATGLNTRMGAREVEAVLERSGASVVILDTDAGLPDPPARMTVLARTELASLVDGGPAEPVAVDPADPAVIIWTSGTTGVPKGAWFDHRNLASAAVTAGVMSAPYDRRLIGLPFAHAGYMAKMWDQLAWGATLVLSPTPWSASSMADVLRDERITVAGAVPTQWAKLLHEAERRSITGLESVRVGVAATAPASPELIRRTADLLGVPLVVRYAMTESPSITGTEIDDPPEVQATTVGRPQDGMAVRLVDESGAEVEAGYVGRIQVAGPAVMRGYWRDQQQTAAALTDGWLTSGDLGRLTPQGHLELVGRSGDMYIRGGYNVYPLEVENVLAAHPGVASAAVIGVSADVIGEIGVAAVVPSDPGAPPTRDELRAWVGEHLADYKRPDRVEVVEALPLTPMLKVDKAALASLLSP